MGKLKIREVIRSIIKEETLKSKDLINEQSDYKKKFQIIP